MGQQSSSETCFTTEDIDGRKYWVEFEQSHFAEGECRYAFKGILHGDGPRNEKACVAKLFKESFAGRVPVLSPDLEVSKKVLEFANKFNEKSVVDTTIHVVVPLIAQMQNPEGFKTFWLFQHLSDASHVNAYKCISLEPFLEGNFQKYNNNWGWESETAPLLTAFTHWTWCASGHKFMACNLRGVRRSNTFTLTEPAVHSQEHRYGDTDQGVAGMEKVLAGHTCNAICRRLDLYNPLGDAKVPARGRFTVYSFQVTERKELKKIKNRKSKYFGLSPLAELH